MNEENWPLRGASCTGEHHHRDTKFKETGKLSAIKIERHIKHHDDFCMQKIGFSDAKQIC